MFFSQMLLSNKGALGTVWVAAHCYRKLKKEQVQKTDISSSVDKILGDEVAAFAHRILAFLLLGVVRIFSKKVDYLLHDSQDVLNKLTEFKNDRNTRESSRTLQTTHMGPTLPSGTKRTRHGITFPKRFELDVFDLEITEDQEIEGSFSRNVRSREEFMLLGDGRGNECTTSGLLYKENVSLSGADSTKHTPPRDVLSFQQMEQDHSTGQTKKTKTSVQSLQTFRRTSFSLDDCLEPMVLDEFVQKQMNDKPSDKIVDISASPLHNKRYHFRSLDILSGTGFALDDRLEPMGLEVSEKELMNDKQSNEDQINDHLLSLETLNPTVLGLEGRLDSMVLDETEKEQMNDKPLDKNPVNFQELIHDMDHDVSASPLHKKRYNFRTLDIHNGTGFELEDRLEPVGLDESENELMNDIPSNENQINDHLSSLEMINETGCGLEGRLDSMVLNETEKEQMNERSFDYNENVVEEEHVGLEKIKSSENLIPESGNFERSEANPVSITVDVTPVSKVTDFATVPTPAPMESAKIVKKKRNTTCDETTMISGNMYKKWLSNTRDLIRKRKVLPQTLLDTWKADKLQRMPHSLEDPYIDGMSSELLSLEVKYNNLEPPETYEVLSPVMEEDREQTHVVGSPVMKEGGEQTQAVGSSVDEDREETLDVPSSPILNEHAPIAPVTPVIGSFENGGVDADSYLLELTSSSESIENPSDGMDWNTALFNKPNSSEGESLEKDTFSARTRVVGCYLHKSFLDKKSKNKDAVLNLSDLTKGKTKKEAAAIFFETLVLKSRDCIDVKQKKPYGDIILQETSNLKSLSLDKEGVD